MDSSRDKGAFILTGSTAPSEDAARHSGAGRFARLRMSTMTFAETKHSTAEASFNGLLDGQDILLAAPDFSVLEVIERMTQGGWPAYLNLSNEDARKSIIDYVADVSAVDVRTPDRTFRDSTKVSTLLRSLSRGIGTEITVSTLAADTGLSRDTVRDYLDALSRIFIHVEQPAWSAHLRSTATLRKAPKRHLADPALAVALLRATPQQILRDLGFAGQLFESQVYHDICALMGRGALISHARDSVGGEVDLVVERGDGRWALIEVKLGSSDETIEEAAASLKRFERQVDLRGYEYPPELVVITATGPSYQRKDGVHVVAFTALAQ